MKTLRKPFDNVRQCPRAGLLLLPLGGTLKSALKGRFIEISAAEIKHLHYNSQRRFYVGGPTEYAWKDTHVQLQTEKLEFAFLKDAWPNGTAEALQQMYKTALDGHDVDFRDYLGFALPNSVRDFGPALTGRPCAPATPVSHGKAAP